jgi:hypothetical protein
MLRVGFEPTIPVFDRAKTVHALDRAATVIGYYVFIYSLFNNSVSISESLSTDHWSGTHIFGAVGPRHVQEVWTSSTGYSDNGPPCLGKNRSLQLCMIRADRYEEGLGMVLALALPSWLFEGA